MDKYIDNKNIKIYLKEDIVDKSSKAILLIHGFCEHSGRYCEFINKLKEIGYSVFSMDLRGHGRTIGKKGDLESIKRVISDVEIIVNYIKNNYNFEKFGIFGHSTGGLVTSLYTSLNNDKVDFIVLSSPAVYCPKKLKAIKYIPYKLLSFIYLKKKQSESKEMLDYSKNDLYSLKKFSIRSIGVIFVEGIRDLNKVLNIKCPTLLLCGKKDILLNEPDRFIEFYNKLNNDKKFIMYEDAKHRIVHNEGSETRTKDILEWLINKAS